MKIHQKYELDDSKIEEIDSSRGVFLEVSIIRNLSFSEVFRAHIVAFSEFFKDLGRKQIYRNIVIEAIIVVLPLAS